MTYVSVKIEQEAQLSQRGRTMLCVCSQLQHTYSAVFRSTSESRPNNIEGENVRPSVRPSVHKKFLQFE